MKNFYKSMRKKSKDTKGMKRHFTKEETHEIEMCDIKSVKRGQVLRNLIYVANELLH